MEDCIVPGCAREGKNKLGVRCRVWHHQRPGKAKTAALWSPDADAYLCDEHALGGADITVLYEPNRSGEIAIGVIAAAHVERRATPIRGQTEESS